MRRSASEAQDEIRIVMSLRWESDCDVQLDIKPLPTNLKFVPGFVEKGLKSALTIQPGISRLKVRPKHPRVTLVQHWYLRQATANASGPLQPRSFHIPQPLLQSAFIPKP